MHRARTRWAVLPLLATAACGVLSATPASADAPNEYRGALVEAADGVRYVAVDQAGATVFASPIDVVDGALGGNSSAGPTIAYIAEQRIGASFVDRLRIVTPSGTDTVLYTAPAGVALSEPALSHDATDVLLVSDSSATSAILNIDVASATLRTIRSSTSTVYFGPSFSPDATWLSWSQQTNAGSDLVVTRFGTGAATVLAHSSGWSFEDSAWSPDGAHIAVTTTGDDPVTGEPYSSVVLYDARTGTWRRLVLGQVYNETAISYVEPAWAADSTAIYSTNLRDHYTTGQFDIALVRTSLVPDDSSATIPMDGFVGASSVMSTRTADAVAPTFTMTATSGAAARLSFNNVDADIAEFVVTRSTGAPSDTSSATTEVGRTRQLSFQVPLPQPQTTYGISVQARDWAGNLSEPVTTTVTSAAASSITVSTPPPRVYWRTGVTLTGLLSGADGPLAGQQVEMYARRAMTSTFVRVATAKTDEQGAYKVGFVPQWTAEFQVRSVTSAVAYSTASAKRVVTVIPAIVLRGSSYQTKVGSIVALTGNVGPNHAGQLITLQRKVNGIWRNITNTRLSSTSTFRINLTMATRGTWEMRMYKAADSDHALQTSPGVTISVI